MSGLVKSVESSSWPALGLPAGCLPTAMCFGTLMNLPETLIAEFGAKSK